MLRQFSWSRRKALYHRLRGLQHAVCSHNSAHTWTSREVRQTFLDYFTSRDHLYVPSSSVIPRKDDGSYFVNAGMNQFKPIFLGTADPSSDLARYRRVVNSQKCIRVGGKHNDLLDVGRDSYHHTFFEMLGSWSFGDYFKERACGLAWSLLTEVYRLPTDRLYVTYFSGSERLGLGPDEECRDIWLSLGVRPDHVIPSGAADNFWDMGDTGPCGPCTEIHYDRLGADNVATLVNTGHPDVLEIWNLVFMAHNRQSDSSLAPLPSCHVDTGMGLERLTAVLQGKQSNYDTDLFSPLFSNIHKLSGCPVYTGAMGPADTRGLDTAYRIVADHTRMVTVAMADGLRPGRTGVDSKLRHVLDQCIHAASQTLGMPRGTLSQLVPTVVESLGEAFPELSKDVSQLQSVIDDSEARYLHLLDTGTKLVTKLVQTDRHGRALLTGATIIDLQDGRWGTSIPADVVVTIATTLGVQNVDMEGFTNIMDERKERQAISMATTPSNPECLPGNRLQLQDVTYLEVQGVPQTRDAGKYGCEWSSEGCVTTDAMTAPAEVVALRTSEEFVDVLLQEDGVCGLVTSDTPFYAEAGGQGADIGHWENEHCTFVVEDVQRTQGYVLHVGRVTRGEVIIGESITPTVNMSRRGGCSINHTATHLLNLALSRVLGDVRQQGSAVSDNKLVFDFLCSKTKVSAADISEISDIVQDLVSGGLPVHVEEIALTDAGRINGIRLLEHEVYPSRVRVLSVGVPVSDLLTPGSKLGSTTSVELCGGTHVDNTARIGHFVITHFMGTQQGTKRVTAITGDAAKQATDNARLIREKMDGLLSAVNRKDDESSWVTQQQHIEKLLMGSEALTLPKVARDELISQIDLVKARKINTHKNKQKMAPLVEEIESLLESKKDASFVVACLQREAMVKQLVSCLSSAAPLRPVLLLSVGNPKKRQSMRPLGNKKVLTGVAYVPQHTRDNGTISAEDWIKHISSDPSHELISSADKSGSGNLPSGSQLYCVTLAVPSKDDVLICEQLGRDYIEEFEQS